MRLKSTIGILFIISSILILAPRGFAVSLPQCGSQNGVTVCLSDYVVASDQRSMLVKGTLTQSWVGVGRLTGLRGWVQSQDGTMLGSGSVQGLPLDIPRNQPVQLEALIQSQYTPQELVSMGIQSVHVRVVAEYCLPYQIWIWTGCAPMPAYQYDRTLTIQELQALYQQYLAQ